MAPQYAQYLPGAMAPQFAPQAYRTTPRPLARNDEKPRTDKPVVSAIQNVGGLIGLNAEQAMARKILFAGSPDTVYQQIMDFYAKVGGFGHLVIIGRSGFMTHAEAEKGLKLFAKEVMPRLKEIAPRPVE